MNSVDFSSQDALKMLKLALQEGFDIFQKTRSGLTPLHYAVGFGDASCVEMLIHSGAPMNVQDWDGNTPLHWAVLRGTPKIVTLLLQEGADPSLCNDYGVKAHQGLLADSGGSYSDQG